MSCKPLFIAVSQGKYPVKTQPFSFFHLSDCFSFSVRQSHADTAHYIPEHRFKYITISLVLVALIIGILIPSIELIIGLVGSTIGVAICIMFPACCFIKTNKKNSTERLSAQVKIWNAWNLARFICGKHFFSFFSGKIVFGRVRFYCYDPWNVCESWCY